MGSCVCVWVEGWEKETDAEVEKFLEGKGEKKSGGLERLEQRREWERAMWTLTTTRWGSVGEGEWKEREEKRRRGKLSQGERRTGGAAEHKEEEEGWSVRNFFLNQQGFFSLLCSGGWEGGGKVYVTGGCNHGGGSGERLNDHRYSACEELQHSSPSVILPSLPPLSLFLLLLGWLSCDRAFWGGNRG